MISHQMPQSSVPGAAASYGVHSEVGRLRKVLVCAPGLAHRGSRRPTPTTCSSTTSCGSRTPNGTTPTSSTSSSRGVEVVELHDVLTETLAVPVARDWLLERKIVANQVGFGLWTTPRVPAVIDDRRLAELPHRRHGHQRPPR